MLFRRKPKPPVRADWLVAGLGNPGPEYAGTRHNVGFEVVERLAAKHGIRIRKAKHRALLGFGSIGEVGVALCKPLTFMNLSGRAVAAIARELSVPPERVLVVADDLDLPFGRIRLRTQGSSGGNKGHESIAASLRSENYPRVKIGIGAADRGDAADHVLSRFSREEAERLDFVMKAAMEACELAVTLGTQAAQARVNGPESRP